MVYGEMVLVTKIYNFLGFEGDSIISDEILWASKHRKDVFLKELNDDKIYGLSRRDGFYLLSNVVNGSQNPFVLG